MTTTAMTGGEIAISGGSAALFAVVLYPRSEHWGAERFVSTFVTEEVAAAMRRLCGCAGSTAGGGVSSEHEATSPLISWHGFCTVNHFVKVYALYGITPPSPANGRRYAKARLA